MSDNDWGDDYGSSTQREMHGNGGSHGRGRFNSHGKGYRNNDNDSGQGDSSWGNDNDNQGSSRGRGSGRSRGRGGRFSDRTGDGDNDDFGGGDDEPPVNDKPRPTYIPPEIDDNDFIGVEVGMNFDKYEHIEVKVSGDSVPKHIESFKNSGLREVLIEKLVNCNYVTPTPIQKYSIPVIINGRDMMASAQTGSGKTVSFLYLHICFYYIYFILTMIFCLFYRLRLFCQLYILYSVSLQI